MLPPQPDGCERLYRKIFWLASRGWGSACLQGWHLFSSPGPYGRQTATQRAARCRNLCRASVEAVTMRQHMKERGQLQI